MKLPHRKQVNSLTYSRPLLWAAIVAALVIAYATGILGNFTGGA